jgi:hypothetical protein
MLQGGDLGGMAQIYLDSTQAVQVIGDDYHCYHSSNSTWDSTAMGIETCCVKTGNEQWKFKKATIERLVAVTRAMIKEYGITDIDASVKRHYDCDQKNHKNCPQMWVNCDYGEIEPTTHPAWLAFKDAIKTGTIDWSRMEGTYID